MTDIEKAYIAGIIDGEGTICIQKQYRKAKRYGGRHAYTLHVAVEMGCKEVPEYLIQKVGFGSLQSRIRPGYKREMFTWRVTGRNAIKFLEQIRCYLILKNREADIAMAFQGTMVYQNRWHRVPEKIMELREQFYLGLRELHGVSVT